MTRRSFLKRTGGASVAALVSWNLAQQAKAGPVIALSVPGSCYVECTSEPTMWSGTHTEIGPIFGPGHRELRIDYWLVGAVRGDTAPAGSKLAMTLHANVWVHDVRPTLLGGRVLIAYYYHWVTQEVGCDPVICFKQFDPSPAHFTNVLPNLGLALKIDFGEVTSVWACDYHPTTPLICNAPVTGMRWEFECKKRIVLVSPSSP